MNRNHFSRFRQTGGARGTRALRGMGVEAKPGGGCLACCFGGGSGREEVPSADDAEASVSSRRQTATASAIAAREKDEASLASRRALANAEPVAEEVVETVGNRSAIHPCKYGDTHIRAQRYVRGY